MMDLYKISMWTLAIVLVFLPRGLAPAGPTSRPPPPPPVARVAAAGTGVPFHGYPSEPRIIPGGGFLRRSRRARRGGTGSGRRRPRGAIYARFSSRYQSSIDDQVAACRQWAAANGVEVDDALVFTDAAVSGRKNRRAGFAALCAALDSGRVDVLIAFATNRLHRSAYKARQFIEEEIVERNLRCACVKSGVDTDNKRQWRLLHSVHSMADEMLVGGIADQVRQGHEGLFRSGRVWGTVTFGYTGEAIPGSFTRQRRPSRRYVVDPVTSTWVRRIFAWYLDEGLSITHLTARLREQGAPLPPKAGPDGWTERAVRTVLGNRRYVGDWSYGASETRWLNKRDYGRQLPHPRRRPRGPPCGPA